jgi:hypothetical protein
MLVSSASSCHQIEPHHTKPSQRARACSHSWVSRTLVHGGHGVQLQLGAVLRQQAKAWLKETVQGVQCNAGDMQPSNFCTMRTQLICIRKNISTSFGHCTTTTWPCFQNPSCAATVSDSLRRRYRSFVSDVCAIDNHSQMKVLLSVTLGTVFRCTTTTNKGAAWCKHGGTSRFKSKCVHTFACPPQHAYAQKGQQ